MAGGENSPAVTSHGEVLSMSDDDFLNMMPPDGETSTIVAKEPVEEDENLPPEKGSEDESLSGTESETTEAEDTSESGEVSETEGNAESSGDDSSGGDTGTTGDGSKPDDNGTGTGSTVKSPDDSSTVGSEPKVPAQSGKKIEVDEQEYLQSKSFVQRIMAPFKANGKLIELKTPEEAVQLMQMGANYTRKMQDIQPHRKVLTMLQNNGLLDEGKLSFLIDLDKKDPEAIKKLVKDAGIDPLDINTDQEPAYLGGNHRVTDEEVSFRNVLDDLSSNPEGQETINVVNSAWDQTSKEALWKSPEILTIIHSHRESGIYDRITSELDRRKTLGQIPPEAPFLQAYKAIGDELTAANAFDDLVTPPSRTAKTVAPVATRVATPKPTVTNGDKASAASPTRSTPQKAKALINPLAMSDDEFLKQMQNRL